MLTGSSKITRRQLLASAAIAPILGRILSQPAFAEAQRKEPPYLALAKYIAPDVDEFPEEKAAADIAAALQEALRSGDLPAAADCRFASPQAASYREVSHDLFEAIFDHGAKPISVAWQSWRESLGVIRRAAFYPLPDHLVRFEIASEREGELQYRVGHWKQTWETGKLTSFEPIEEQLATAKEPLFQDVTAAVFGSVPSFREQLAKGIPYWRASLDPATGIDIYGSNGIAAGDIDNDGADEIFVSQAGGLPNRLYKISAEGAASDITAQWGVNLLDDTSAALFLDLRNIGRQDLVVLRSSGPVLYINEGSSYRLRTDAFRFATAPAGGFTGMAAADFDRDGKLDLYLCCYVYFQSEAQYTYASPYHDAHNGPPNFLFRNGLAPDGSGYLDDCTRETGIDQNNDRFSFAPAWCDFNSDGWPDLYVANDFGRKNLYVNDRGRFRDKAAQFGVEDIGPGMSASWFDADVDGKPDLYVANMWTAAGQRVSHSKSFHLADTPERKDAYFRHTKGNSLFLNRTGHFEETTAEQHAAFGRWAWSSGGHDLDNDGSPELFVTCGMITGNTEPDLGSFFWREVVARAPATAAPSAAYESGWNALNQFIREGYSWNGNEPNVLHRKRGNRYFDYSGVSGLDVAEDSRAFAVFDFDDDGRPDLILKSRLGPQLRLFQNNCAGRNRSVTVILRGKESNRDAIGAKVTVNGSSKWLDAGSGFLSQHSKRLIFGLGEQASEVTIEVSWPLGKVQTFTKLAPGQLYTITEGDANAHGRPYRGKLTLASGTVAADNSLKLRDTWFAEPLPLPIAQDHVRLLYLTSGEPISPPAGVPAKILNFKSESADTRACFEIFRRYLFDWRAPLVTPLAFLLDRDGRAIRIYGELPSAEQVRADIAASTTAIPSPCPFPGTRLGTQRRDFYKFGAAFLWAGFPEQALRYLDKSIEQNPDNARVLILAGQIELQAGRQGAAERRFRKALEVNPNAAEAWSGIGDVFDAKGDLTQALASYRRALSTKPDLLYTLLNAGQACDKLEQPADAEDLYRRALALDSGNADALNGIGLALAKQNHPEQAREYFEKAITAKKDHSGAINNLGVLYLRLGKPAEAIAAFEYGIRVAPEEGILYLNLGRTYVSLGERAKARQTMQTLLDRKPDDVTARRALRELETP